MASTTATRPQCDATTAKGERCTNRAREGETTCGAHSGSAGRRTKLDAERRELIVQAIRAGSYDYVAAGAAGVHPSTFARWMEQGELDQELDADTEFRELYEAVKKAGDEAEVYAVGIVRQAMRGGDWKAAMTYLERKHPKRWARREVREVGGIGGGPVTLLDLERAVDGAGEQPPVED